MEKIDLTNKLDELCNKYKLLIELREKYKQGIENRRELANRITTTSDEIKKLLADFNGDLFQDRLLFDFITDYEQILKLLLKFANDGDNRYDLRKYSIKSRESDNWFVWVISDRYALDNLNIKEDHPQYYKHEFTRLISENNSIVLITNYGYYWDIAPDANNRSVRRTNMRKFHADGFMSSLYCYTYSDALSLAVDKLEVFINRFGGDTVGHSLDTIIGLAEKAYKDSEKNKPCEAVIFRNEEEKDFSDDCQKYNYQNIDSEGRQKTLNRIGKRKNS